MKYVFKRIWDFFKGRKTVKQINPKPIIDPENEKWKIDIEPFEFPLFETDEISSKNVITEVSTLTPKEKWILSYLRSNSIKSFTATEIGKEYGITVKNKTHYTSWHSRNVLLRMVELNLVKVKEGRYSFKFQ